MIPYETLQRLYEHERTHPFESCPDELYDSWLELWASGGASLHKLIRIGNRRRPREFRSRFCKGRSHHSQRLLAFLAYVRKHGRKENRHGCIRPLGNGKSFAEVYDIIYDASTSTMLKAMYEYRNNRR